jgi:uridylate kinase
MKYKRVVIKLGGETLSGENGFGINTEKAQELALRIKKVHDLGAEIVIVMGAGNLWRGAKGQAKGMDRSIADEIGMLATVMNCLALEDALKKLNIGVRLHTSVSMQPIAEPYSRLRVDYQLKKGYIVIVGGGTGHPYFTTDTAAALRAAEIQADAFIKATKVDGIYTEDPKKNSQAKKIEEISYMDYIDQKIKVLDNTAITLCMNNHLPILVIGLSEEDGLSKVVQGEKIGSIIRK